MVWTRYQHWLERKQILSKLLFVFQVDKVGGKPRGGGTTSAVANQNESEEVEVEEGDGDGMILNGSNFGTQDEKKEEKRRRKWDGLDFGNKYEKRR